MKVMWNSLLNIIVLLIMPSLSVASFIENENEGGYERKCSLNFTSYKINTSNGYKTICASISLEKVTWDEAKFRCNLQFAQVVQRIYFNTSLHKDLLNKGIDALWIGIRRKGNFFITEYPSRLFREDGEYASEHWGYYWSDGEPRLSDCVALNISTGSLSTQNCSNYLPFVCEDDSKKTTTVLEDLTCPTNWKLSFPLSTSVRKCISALLKARLYENAEKFCSKNGGRLASLEEYGILHFTKTFSLQSGKYWLKKYEECRITKRVNGYINDTSPENCSLRYPFICVKDYETAPIKVRLSPNTIDSVSTSTMYLSDLVSCDLEIEPTGLVNMENKVLFQWYKDDIPIPLNSYVIRLGYISAELKRDPYVWDTASRQGYYHCEVKYLGSDKAFLSPKLKFFYSDIATYMVEIHGIKVKNELDYSHEDFSNCMDDFHATTMSSVLEKMKVRYQQVEWDFFSKSTHNGTTTMKIVVYIYKIGDADFEDRTTCEELKVAFEEQQSIPVFIKNFSVRINCGDLPSTNEYFEVKNSLKAINSKLEQMEITQAYILEKLQNLESLRELETTTTNRKIDFDVSFLSEAIEDLKLLEKDLLGAYSENTRLENHNDGRERNEIEERLLFPQRKQYLLVSERKKFGIFGPRSSSPGSKPHGIVTEQKKYIYSPGKELEYTAPERIQLERDL